MLTVRSFLLATMCASALLVAVPYSSADDVASAVGAGVDKLANAKGDDYWSAVGELESLGPDAVPALVEALKRPEVKVRMGVAKALYRCGEKKEAVATLMKLVGEKDRDVRRTSADILADLTRDDGNYGTRKDIESSLQDALDNADDQKLMIALSRALYSVSANIRAIDQLKTLLKAKDADVRKDAALALAEVDDFDACLPELKKLALEPGDKGSLARLYLKHKRLEDDILRKAAGGGGRKYAVIDEILDLIKTSYVDASKIDEQKLLEGAARGIADTLDAYTIYMNAKERQEMIEGIDKKYGGVGAHVSMRDDFLTIELPVYDCPAYRAGLRSLDRIVEIDGQSTYKRDIEEVVGRLRGEPGTKVTIKVARRGWTEPRTFELVRARIEIKTAVGDLLPGNIGFIQITSFGGTTDREMREAIDQLTAQGAVAFIFDLRGNPGGMLPEVCKMVDRFVPAGKVICTTKDKNGNKIEEYISKDEDAVTLPCVALVNEGTASAAEIFSGSLQDFKVATIVGERTYGKGLVQRIEPLKSTQLKSAFKITFAKYYLPSGRSINLERDRLGRPVTDAPGGVVPDIEVKVKERDLWKEFEFARVLDSGALDAYVNERWDASKDSFYKLAEDVNVDPAAYPDFDRFFAGLKSHLEPAEVAQLLRIHIRRRVSDDRKRPFIFDLLMDTQLQRGVLEICSRTNVNPESIPTYKTFAHAFDEKK